MTSGQGCLTSISGLLERVRSFRGYLGAVEILVVVLGVAIGAGLAWGSIGTSEPDLARTGCCCLGRIALQVPVS